MVDELIDICDEENNLTSEQKMISEAHAKGLWHRAVQIFVFSSKGDILLQLRAKNKIICPDVWDISASGHVNIGEEPIISALRETKEEISIKASVENIEFIEVRKEKFDFENAKNYEFMYIYFLRYDDNMTNLVFQKEEIQEIKLISIYKLEEDLKLHPEKFVPYCASWFRMIELIKSRIE